MAEYIEREAALKRIDTAISKFARHGEIVSFIADCRASVIYAPTADVVEVRHGKWGNEKWTHTDQHICSLCHCTVRVHPQSVEYRYCPYCGAKMDGKGEGE